LLAWVFRAERCTDATNPSIRDGSIFCSDKEKSKMKIYVGNMPFSMDEGQLRSLFSEFGDVDSVNVITDRETGRPRGFGFVEMQDEDARTAISELHEKEVEGRNLNVNEARPRQNRGGGGGGGGRGRY
jgi:RNA recognition motif-containing protein